MLDHLFLLIAFETEIDLIRKPYRLLRFVIYIRNQSCKYFITSYHTHMILKSILKDSKDYPKIIRKILLFLTFHDFYEAYNT